MSKYIDFEQIPFNGKTKRFKIWSISHGDLLGKIQYRPGCLQDIEVFLNVLNDERK